MQLTTRQGDKCCKLLALVWSWAVNVQCKCWHLQIQMQMGCSNGLKKRKSSFAQVAKGMAEMREHSNRTLSQWLVGLSGAAYENRKSKRGCNCTPLRVCYLLPPMYLLPPISHSVQISHLDVKVRKRVGVCNHERADSDACFRKLSLKPLQ